MQQFGYFCPVQIRSSHIIYIRNLSVSACVLLLCLCSYAQVTKVRGVVIDAENGLPNPILSRIYEEKSP